MKNLVLLLVTVFMLAGCNAHKEAVEKQAKYDRKVEQAKEAQRIIDALEASQIEAAEEEAAKEVVTRKNVVKPTKLKGTYYRMLTKSIEVFAYRASLRNTNTLNDKKLSKPFYIKGNFIKVEKIYTSKIGDKYGKISGKNLLVSMDDLTNSEK